MTGLLDFACFRGRRPGFLLTMISSEWPGKHGTRRTSGDACHHHIDYSIAFGYQGGQVSPERTRGFLGEQHIRSVSNGKNNGILDCLPLVGLGGVPQKVVTWFF